MQGSPVGCQVQYKVGAYDSTLPADSHDYFEIYVYESGNIAYMVEDLQVDMYPGDVMIIPPGRMHRTFPVTDALPGEYRRYLINLSEDYLAGLGGEGMDLLARFREAYHTHGSIARFEEGSFEELKRLLSAIIEAKGEPGAAAAFLFRTQLTYFLLRLMAQLAENPSGSREIRALSQAAGMKKYKLMPSIIRYVNDHLTEPLSLEGIAGAFHISPSYMAHCFKEYTGLSVYRYIRNKRIILARKLIAAGQPVVSAQQSCGIPDYPNFHRAFTRVAGMSPLQYRNTVRQPRGREGEGKG